MTIQENVPLAPFTTFKIGGPARFFCVVENAQEITEAINFAKEHSVPFFVLGGGSNVVVSDKGFNGLVMHPNIMGIDVVYEDEQFIHYKVGAGENWDNFVAQAVERNQWGIENLSHIPGNTGAVAVQNVGAYGQEASQVVEAVEVYDAIENEVKILPGKELGFSYRTSIFNTSQKGRYVILYTVFKLSKHPKPNFIYRDLKEKFAAGNATIAEIRQAIIEIRNKKFPFPVEAVKGNAGSFFKNPIVSEEEYERMRELVRENLGLEAAERMDGKIFRDGNFAKIPAAFLLDACGMKNTEFGGAAINANQPLVIINKTGTATAKDVLGLAEIVKTSVKEKTGISLAQEPELVGF